MISGKNAIITGASVGLGREIAMTFVKNGANVCICAREGSELKNVTRLLNENKKFDDQIITCKETDIAYTNEVDSLFEYSEKIFGNIDVFVNNAGIYGPIGPIETNDWDSWEYACRVNFLGMIYFVRKSISHMKKNGRGGKIICLSGGGATKPMPNFSSYAATKAAVVRAAETFAIETRDFDIDINCLAPGALNTRLLDEALSVGKDILGEKKYAQLIEQKESGGASLKNAANCALFLASEKSNGITGRLISAVWDDWKSFPENWHKWADTDYFTLRRFVPSE